jgi:putative hydrolase of the HAD superfamily
LISATVSSSEHGFMKPHPSIFSAALQLVGVRPAEAVMVGDSLKHDVEGAIRAGLRGVLLHRGDTPTLGARELGVPVIRSLRELRNLLIG